MFWMTDNPGRDADRYIAWQEAKLEKLPECEICGERIQDDYLYEVFGHIVCEDCIDDCRNSVDSYIDDGYVEEDDFC